MPGRVSGRSSRPSRAASPRKSSARTVTSRASTASRISSPRIDVPEESPWSSLRAPICAVFADAQRSNAGHRKSVINLRKLQGRCCYPKPGSDREHDWTEETFNAETGRCVLRLMTVKRSEPVGDRVVRFLGLFLKHASDKDSQLLPESAADETLLETPTSRLTSHILSLLLPLLSAKEKTVRFRSTQLISHIINSLDSIDDDLFQLLRLGLLKRMRDKESMVRVQAVLGLGRLAGNEIEGDQQEADSDDEDAGGLMETLLQALQNDPSADVRRSLLLNLPLTPTTLPYLLERARDQDAVTRRTLYSRLLPALGDFRHLSLSMREKLLRWGLRDRDDTVRKAAAKLFRERWIEDCARSRHPETEAGENGTGPNFDGLLELLERIDVVNAGVENGIALEAMKEFWDGRPDYRESLVLDDAFWDGLTAESVFMARTFNDFCRQAPGGKLEDLLEVKMPEVTKFAFYLQRYANQLVENLKRVAAREDGPEEDQAVEQEFIVEQLLHMAQTLDYTDEVGRRKMFSLMRETLAIAELPDEVTKLVIEVLRGLCGPEAGGEREFCGVVLEAVAEVHDTILGDEENAETSATEDSFHSARSELSNDTPAKAKKKASTPMTAEEEEEEEAKAIREIMVNMKCLHIAQCMLENVEGSLQSNVHLMTMLNNLVVPAVRSHEAPIRERGLLCLGLCCLLDRTLAEENLTLFLHCFNKGHDALQVYALHIMSDILTTHGSALLESEAFEKGKPLFKIFSKALRAEDRPEVQAAACTAVCKLMLGRVVKDEDLLKLLVVSYFDPAMASNLGLRQALSYFLPVYCHSRQENQQRMQRVAVSAIHSLIMVSDTVDEEEEMVGLSIIASHLVDWTDPRKLVSLSSSDPPVATGDAAFDDMKRKEAMKGVNGDVHLDLAMDLLEKIGGNGSKEEKKIFASMLSKLYVTSNCTAEKLSAVIELAQETVEGRVFSDATSRNALAKFTAALEKAGVQAGGLDARDAEAEEGVVVDAESGELEQETEREEVEEDGEEGGEPRTKAGGKTGRKGKSSGRSTASASASASVSPQASNKEKEMEMEVAIKPDPDTTVDGILDDTTMLTTTATMMVDETAVDESTMAETTMTKIKRGSRVGGDSLVDELLSDEEDEEDEDDED